MRILVNDDLTLFHSPKMQPALHPRYMLQIGFSVLAKSLRHFILHVFAEHKILFAKTGNVPVSTSRKIQLSKNMGKPNVCLI